MSQRSRSSLIVLVSVLGLLGPSCANVARQSRDATGVGRVFRPGASASARIAQAPASQPADARGATTTRLADGRWLVAGGESADGATTTARVIDPHTGRATALAGLQVARTGHSATLLAEGTVLIAGGRGLGGSAVTTAEIFDPQSGTFLPVAIAGARARRDHTATLLTDGRVLIAGGSGAEGALGDAEVWDVAQATATPAPGAMTNARTQHEAELLADGRVRLSRGVGADGSRVGDEDVFDPRTGRFASASPREEDRSAPRLVASMPENGAFDVPLDVRIGLRFSQPLLPDSLSVASIVMKGPDGPIDLTLVPAEQGRLAFVSPRLALIPDTTYVLTIAGAIDRRGVPIVSTAVTLTTRADERPAAIPDEEAWTPGGRHWRSERPESPWKSLKPLEAPQGVTALAGQVLRLNGLPLADVTLTLEGRSTRTDRTGRFLLKLDGLATGEHTFAIDARTANRPRRTYGFYEVRWKLTAGKTNVLPFTIWSPLVDTAHAVTIPSPTTQETVVTSPLLPGLELHIPAGTTLLDEKHKVVRSVSMTPIPLDRTPFPLPVDATFTMFFTIQPGGAYLQTAGASKGAWLVYPPAQHARVGQRVQFLNYDPDDRGWYVYGMGTVMAGKVVPDARTRIYGFAGASFNDDNTPPPATWNPPGDCCRAGGDPVDLATGIFTEEMTDVAIPDVMPLVLKRSYNSQDPAVRAFGRGWMDPYRIFLYTEQAFEQADLILPDGARIHYVRTSATGLPWYQTEFEHVSSPTSFYKSTIKWSDADSGWHLRLKDGTLYVFGHGAPLQAIRDRNGNETRLTWSSTTFLGLPNGNLLRVTSPNGRWLELSYYASSRRVYQVKDNIGRTWTYGYDANENLTTVTDPENHATTYLYDTSSRMIGVRPRNLAGTTTNLVTNEYTTAADAPTPIGWVKKQTHADGGEYRFSYSVLNGKSILTDITEPDGSVRRVTMNVAGYTVGDTRGLGEPEEQGASGLRSATGNFVATSTDSLNRATTYVRDAMGNQTSVTTCQAGQSPCSATTPGALTTTYTYDSTFNQVTSVTDPLGHTTTFEYDERGNLVAEVDALDHRSTRAYNAAGLVSSTSDALQHATTYTYVGGDLNTTTDSLSHISTRVTDAVGRTQSVTDALGQTTRYTYDANDHVRTITDALGQETILEYLPAGQLKTVTNARGHTTLYEYDAMGRLTRRTDPLQRTELFEYDLRGNLRTSADRKGQITTRTYDTLARLIQIDFNNASTIGYQYDGANRVTHVTDSASGTIQREFDDFDRLISETTPQGSIAHTYDDAHRPATMTVTGQPVVTYEYDAADRLSTITRGSATVTITHDAADRRTRLVLPNGLTTEYGYDDGSKVSTLTYKVGSTTVGDLSYSYDTVGNVVGASGSFARTALPQATAAAVYDAGNRLVQWGNSQLSHDENGNLTLAGLSVFTWNERNQLAAVDGPNPMSYQYDGEGRRIVRTSGGDTVAFLYDGLNTVQELTAGLPTANILRAGLVDESFERETPSGRDFSLIDSLGSTLGLSDLAGTIGTTYNYEPFGRTVLTGSANGNPAQFTGRDADSIDLYYYRARYYSPLLQRFISPDPVEDGSYAYADDNPINLADPLGLFSIDSSCRCPKDLTEQLRSAERLATEGAPRIEQKSMRECIQRRLVEGTVKCGGEKCEKGSVPDKEGRVLFGHSSPFGKTITVCAPAFASDRELGRTIIHEFAHTCKAREDRARRVEDQAIPR